MVVLGKNLSVHNYCNYMTMFLIASIMFESDSDYLF